MSHKIKSVRTSDNMTLLAVFENGIEKAYDIRQMERLFPQFCVLKTNLELYKSVQVDVGGYGIAWNDDLDIDAEEIWENGVETGNRYAVDIYHIVAVQLTEAREKSGMTQKQLSQKTKIAQGDISKIERSNANPSISTLNRLAEGMGMRLEVKFIKQE